MPTTHTTDIAIIGAGPAGLFTVFEAGFLGYQCVVLDALPEAGGQLAALYPEKPIYDIPGYPVILAGELVTKLIEQAAPFNPVYLLGNPVLDLIQNEDQSFTLSTKEAVVHAKVIVIAGGGGMFTPRKPKLENLANYEDSSIFYAVTNKAQFTDKTLVLAGGGDSAVDWAVELAEIAQHIHIVHRRNDFRAAAETVNQMHALVEQGKITLHTPCQLNALNGIDGQLTQVEIKDWEDQLRTLEADALLCFFGLAPTLGPFAAWGLASEDKKLLVDPTSMHTNKEGILAVGDIAKYPGKLSLILTGFAEAALAAKGAQKIIDPDKTYKLVYSTSKGVPSS